MANLLNVVHVRAKGLPHRRCQEGHPGAACSCHAGPKGLPVDQQGLGGIRMLGVPVSEREPLASGGFFEQQL